MIRQLRKTAARTARYLAEALAWREPYRDQALVAWLLVVGAVWIAIGGSSDDHWARTAIFGIYLVSVLAAVCAIDARFGIIPDALVISLAVGGLAAVLVQQPAHLIERILEAAVAGAGLGVFRVCYRKLRGYDGLGFGDVKFLAAGTVWVGLPAIPVVVLIAVASALAAVVLLKLQRHPVSGQSAIAFGPHLAVGVWLTWAFALPALVQS
jgi:leader peptidase (prepilin peptidase)/N-methyltransferase